MKQIIFSVVTVLIARQIFPEPDFSIWERMGIYIVLAIYAEIYGNVLYGRSILGRP